MTQERILIVDGDISESYLLRTRLEALGYGVAYASTAIGALDVLKSKWVDLIVLSTKLQGSMDGFQLFKRIKKKKTFTKIPIVVVAKKKVMKKAFEYMGADAFFVKPFSMNTFLTEIKDMLTKKVLVLSTTEDVKRKVVKAVSRHPVVVDSLSKLNKFYSHITLYRYSMVVLEHNFKAKTADKLLNVVRESPKNKDVPVIIIASDKITAMNEESERTFKLLKNQCAKMKKCSFMGKGYSKKQFAGIFKKYLDIL